jgi:hypothetical protein
LEDNMPENVPVHAPHAHSDGKGMMGFLQGETAGLPNWAWLVVIAAGVTLAFIVPRLTKGATAAKDTTGQGGGIGLAIDPTTGLPYAVEGLVPSGGTTGGGSGGYTGNIPNLQEQNIGTVRAVRAGDPYDTSHAGIPLTSAIGSGTREENAIPFGAQVQLVSGPIEGPASPQGTTAYYQVRYQGKTGYVSSFDLPTVQNYSPLWPGGTYQQRLQ